MIYLGLFILICNPIFNKFRNIIINVSIIRIYFIGICNNLKIATKLLISFLIVAIIAGALGIYGISKISTINNAGKGLYEQNTKPLGDLAYIGTQYQRIRVNVLLVPIILNYRESN
ncbi:MCP four helix bundle domain-containing protein [Ruminiclostridium herbifermentans]|uniref:MCP four helix bundle domain-containing protein n=1 Tax=Ruminiclostridium herbifermentans TaxID=2488810 RepID=A0A4U7JJI2_9FIRM|nr:MCP four helix bundle domain-containing protein [Ruminiclostridium herbifermentans]